MANTTKKSPKAKKTKKAKAPKAPAAKTKKPKAKKPTPTRAPKRPAGAPRLSKTWEGRVPGGSQIQIFPSANNESSAREALRKVLKVDRLPAGSVVISAKACPMRKTNPAAKKRMSVLGQYSKMLWEADGKRKSITAYGKEAARMARQDGKI